MPQLLFKKNYMPLIILTILHLLLVAVPLLLATFGFDNEYHFDYEDDFLVRPNSWQEFAKSFTGEISWSSSCLLQELLEIS